MDLIVGMRTTDYKVHLLGIQESNVGAVSGENVLSVYDSILVV